MRASYIQTCLTALEGTTNQGEQKDDYIHWNHNDKLEMKQAEK